MDKGLFDQGKPAQSPHGLRRLADGGGEEICRYCKTPIERDCPTVNHGTFHNSCFDQWMLALAIEGRQFFGTRRVQIASA